MQETLTSERLVLRLLAPADSEFIFELVNTPEWIKFIGERNVTTKEKAERFVQSIISNPNVNYWVVRLRDKDIPVGIVSLVKRDYLDFFDVGFAFLPQHTRQGFAYEATLTFLKNLAKQNSFPTILATSNKENSNSIALLKKLGFSFEKQIKIDNEELFIFSIATDQILIDCLTNSFFQVFTNANGKVVDLEKIFDLCLTEAVIIKKSGESEEVYDLHSFVEPRKTILTDGTLTNFEEKEIDSETKIINGIAQRYSRYEKSGCLNSANFKQRGNKFFQYIKTQDGWKISAVVWEDEDVSE